jgi:hypothetical protein
VRWKSSAEIPVSLPGGTGCHGLIGTGCAFQKIEQFLTLNVPRVCRIEKPLAAFCLIIGRNAAACAISTEISVV